MSSDPRLLLTESELRAFLQTCRDVPFREVRSAKTLPLLQALYLRYPQYAPATGDEQPAPANRHDGGLEHCSVCAGSGIKVHLVSFYDKAKHAHLDAQILPVATDYHGEVPRAA